MSGQKAILYFSDNALNIRMSLACKKYIEQSGLPITSVTLKPTNFGRNIVVQGERSYKTMYRQILTGLEAMTEDVVYFAEHDVLYSSEHFKFVPPDPETYYYNGNYWFLRMTDGFAVHYDVSPLSGLVVYREPAVIHFKERLDWVSQHGFGMVLGFEPFTHHRIKWEHWYKFEKFYPSAPNVDLCHGGNLTPKRWSTEKFIRKPKFWEESDVTHIPGWPDLPKTIERFFPLKDGQKVDVPIYRHKAKPKPVELSVLIPARNEQFVARTVQDILEHSGESTEAIVVLDGAPANPPIQEHQRVRVVELAESIGQRAATNMAARMSTAKYVMKVDAHCAFDQGFDVKMMADMQDDWTTVPIMCNLHVFDWVCPDGHRRYQGPSGLCTVCGKETIMDIVWIAKNNPQSKAYCFDSEPHFRYFREFSKRPEGKGKLTETMSLQGSCWMLTRDKYWELNVCDESFGSWGSQGIEVACRTWLSGGRVMCNQKTWYAHCFRTQGFDFGFPYPISGQQVEHAKSKARETFFNGSFPGQVRPLAWLIDKFWPIPGWTDEDRRKLDKVVESSNDLISVREMHMVRQPA